jgi:hypothetical protein
MWAVLEYLDPVEIWHLFADDLPPEARFPSAFWLTNQLYLVGETVAMDA